MELGASLADPREFRERAARNCTAADRTNASDPSIDIDLAHQIDDGLLTLLDLWPTPNDRRRALGQVAGD